MTYSAFLTELIYKREKVLNDNNQGLILFNLTKHSETTFSTILLLNHAKWECTYVGLQGRFLISSSNIFCLLLFIFVYYWLGCLSNLSKESKDFSYSYFIFLLLLSTIDMLRTNRVSLLLYWDCRLLMFDIISEELL